MERKAKLFSPLLIAAMVISLVAGAVGVVVTTQPALANGTLEVTIDMPADEAIVDVCQNFQVKATVTNNSSGTLTSVQAHIDVDPGAEIKVGADPQDLGTLAGGCAAEAVWTLHCVEPGDVDIDVWATSSGPTSSTETITLHQYIEVEITEPDPDCACADFCVSSDFDIRATITNTCTTANVTVNATASVDRGTVADPETVEGIELDPLESKEVAWEAHCDMSGPTTITVVVVDEASGEQIGEASTAICQRGLLVDIVSPYEYENFCTCENFYVNAVLTNTCDVRLVNVTANISLRGPSKAQASWVAGGDPLTAPYYTQDVGTIEAKVGTDVFWELHCDGPGQVVIEVEANGERADGTPVYDSDTVCILQDVLLQVEIVEPPFMLPDGSIRPPDGFTVCNCTTFVVKAHIRHIGCVGNTTRNTYATINITSGDAEILAVPGTPPVTYNQTYLDEMQPGDEVIVAWTLHCTGDEDAVITVDAEFQDEIEGAQVIPDTVVVKQADGPADVSVMILDPVTSTDICACDYITRDTCCENTFNVTAMVTNSGCQLAYGLAATLNVSCGPGLVYVAPIDITQSVTGMGLDEGVLGGLSSAYVTWPVTCRGAGDVTFHVDMVGWDLLGAPLTISPSNEVTVHQKDFIVEITEVAGVDPSVTVSTCQQFTVTARFFNCSDEEFVKDRLAGVMDFSEVGAVLADEPITLLYYDAHGVLKGTQTEEDPDITLVRSGVSKVMFELERICECCYVDVTWTLECMNTLDGDIDVWVEDTDADDEVLDQDSTAVSGYFFITGGKASIDLKNSYSYAGLEGDDVYVAYVTNTYTGFGTIPDGVYCAEIWEDFCNWRFTGTVTVSNYGTTMTLMGMVTATCPLPDCASISILGGLIVVKDGVIVPGDVRAQYPTSYKYVSSYYYTGPIEMSGKLMSICQQWKPHLVAGLAAFRGKISEPVKYDSFDPNPADTFAVCQDFTVVATVTNIGEATAANVELTLDVDALVGLGASTTEPLTKLVDGGFGPGVVPGWQSAKAMWVFHCDGLGSLEIEVTDLSGIDVNTGKAIPEENIDILCAVTLYQVIADLVIEIVQPETCDWFAVDQEFAVKALISNLSPEWALAISANITYTSTTADLLDVNHKVLGNMAPGAVFEVSWQMRCISAGDVTIVARALTGPAVFAVSNTVVVHQEGPPELYIDILSPDGWDTPIATSQEFAVTAVVRNVGTTAAAGVTATIGDLDTITTSADGVSSVFMLDDMCITPGSETIYVTPYGSVVPVALVRGVDYVIDYAMGMLYLTTPPALGSRIDSIYLEKLSLVEGAMTQALGDISPLGYKIVSWTLHADTSCDFVDDEEEKAWFNVFAQATNQPCNPFFSYPPYVYECPRDSMGIWIYPAAHLVVDISSPDDGEEITVCQEFDVVATVANTGQADAWEVQAILSVQPEASARLALSGDDARAGYTKYLGTLVGWGQEAVEGVGYKEVTWTMHCKEACNSTITVTATGRDELGYFAAQILGGVWAPADVMESRSTIMEWDDEEYEVDCYPGIAIPSWLIEPDSVTVKQVDPAMLVVESLISPAQVEVCQNFKVSAIVKNVGGSEATDVVATIDLTGIDASLTTGTAGADLDDIEAGSLKVASWELHCDAAGSGAIAVTADAANTAPAMAAGGVLQVLPAAAICLAVEIDAPAEVTVEQAYFVTAVVTNLCGMEACDVIATITVSGEAELASGETAAKDLGCISPGDSKAIDWEVDCTDVGGVNVWVSASATGTNTAIDSAAVRQAEYLDWSEVLAESLLDINAALESIDGNVVTMTSDVGTIKTDIAGINLTVVSIDEGVATIETNLLTLKGTVTSIDDGVATIATDLGVVKADVSGIADDANTLKSRSIWTLPILILVALGAIALIIGVAIVASRKRPVPVVIERKEE